MTKTLDQQISEAKAQATTARIAVDLAASMPNSSLIRVTSERDPTITYAITRDPEGKLTCSCPARVVCKHIGLVLSQGINYHVLPGEEVQVASLAALGCRDAGQTSLEACSTPQSEASVALMLAERSERTLAGQTYSQEERLRALAYLPLAIAAYAVVMGPAHGWQWHQAKEEQWDRYQSARIGDYLYW